MFDPRQLEEYANSFHFGFLKPWKANGIMLTVQSIPGLQTDPDRLLNYLKGCLVMEGFIESDVEQIRNWMLPFFPKYIIRNYRVKKGSNDEDSLG